MSIINGGITEKSGVCFRRQTTITMAVNVLICLARRSQKLNKMYIHIDIKSKYQYVRCVYRLYKPEVYTRVGIKSGTRPLQINRSYMFN